MSYTPTNWVNGVTTAGPTNLNKLELGLQAAAVIADAAIPKPSSPAANDGLVWNGSAWINAKILDAHIAAGAAIAASKIAGYPSDGTKFLRGDGSWSTTSGAVFPPAFVGITAGSSAPATWVFCDGASYPRTGGTYDALFAAIGTAYGAVDGTHFNVPNIIGRTVVGYGGVSGHTDVSALGNNEGALLAARRPKHPSSLSGSVSDTIGVSDPGHPHSVHTVEFATGGTVHGLTGSFTTIGSGVEGDVTLIVDSAAAGVTKTGGVNNGTLAVGTAGMANDTPAYIVLNFIIKL